MATQAAKVTVARPKPVTTCSNSAVPPSTGYSRSIRKMPAFTMVAECR